MDIQKIIEELRAERARLDDALLHLEKLSLARMPRRGRPPNWKRGAGLTAARNGRGLSDSTIRTRHITADA
jgi:hypothetical protein